MNPAQPFRVFCVIFKLSRELRARIEARSETDAEAIAEYLYRVYGDRNFEQPGSESIFDSEAVEWEHRS